MIEFQEPLFDSVLEDLQALKDKVQPYRNLEVSRMCMLRDYPEDAATRMWYKQVILSSFTMITSYDHLTLFCPLDSSAIEET